MCQQHTAVQITWFNTVCLSIEWNIFHEGVEHQVCTDCILVLVGWLCMKENTKNLTFSVKTQHSGKFIASINYIYHQHVGIHIKHGEFLLKLNNTLYLQPTETSTDWQLNHLRPTRERHIAASHIIMLYLHCGRCILVWSAHSAPRARSNVVPVLTV